MSAARKKSSASMRVVCLDDGSSRMVIDSSALVAIALDEPRGSQFIDLILAAPSRLVSAPNLVEISVVLSTRKGPLAEHDLDTLLLRLRIEVVPFDEEQALIARDAHRRYGKGRHAAGLNICDCFSYALAWTTGTALLFSGDDFSKTDIEPAWTESEKT